MDKAAQGVSAALAHFVATAHFEQLDGKSLVATRHTLLDGLGVSLAATGLEPACKIFQQQVLLQNAAPRARVWGSGQKSAASLAAFANGALAHALDFEDTHDAALVHPNAAVIPAALAIAEAEPAINGKQLLTAIAVGCEIVCRLGLALQVPLDHYGWYPPPILSAFGAAAAAAKLYALNEAQVLNAFSLVLLQATCSAEIKYNPESTIRAVRDAFPAQAGIVAAELALGGVTGFAQPFEGKAGFFALFARGNYEPSALTNNLGSGFEVANLSFKAWPSCRGTHVFTDLMSRLMRDHAITADEIVSVDAFGNGINRMLAEPIATKRRPKSSIDAKFSIPFCVAWTALRGEPSLASFLPEGIADQDVTRFAERISYQADGRYADKGAGMLQGRLRLQLQDGRQIEAEGNSAPGSREQPLSESMLREKFLRCCSFYTKPFAADESQALAESILHLEQAQNLEQELFKFL